MLKDEIAEHIRKCLALGNTPEHIGGDLEMWFNVQHFNDTLGVGELREKAEKWDKVKEIAEVVVLAPCGECCEFNKLCSAHEIDLCDAAGVLVDALSHEPTANLNPTENPQ